MEASDDSFSLRALSREWIFPLSDAMTTLLLPAVTATELVPAAVDDEDNLFCLLLAVLPASDRVASLD